MTITTNLDNRHVFYKKAVPCEFMDTPLRCNHFALIFCNCGDARVEINYTVYHAKTNSVIFLSPLDVVAVKECCAGFDASMIIVPVSLVMPHLMNVEIDFYEKIKTRPVNVFFGKELEMLNEIFDILDIADKMHDYEEFETTVLHLAAVIFTILKKNLKKHEGCDNVGKNCETRKKTLFKKFVKYLIDNRSKSREVLYYANALGISSGYLNEVCNEVSDYSAKDIIDNAVASCLKYELSYTDKSIQELADEFDFPSQSYLSRYYKRITGLSPSEFRRSREKGA